MWCAINSTKESPWAAVAFRHARDQRGQHRHRALRGLSARWMRTTELLEERRHLQPTLHVAAAAYTAIASAS